MVSRFRGYCWIAAGVVLLSGWAAVRGQETAPPPKPLAAPTDVLPPAAPFVQPATALIPPPPHAAPPACAPYEDHNGPLLVGDPLLERPGYPKPGWFGAAEADLFGPHLRNRLVNTVDVAGLFTDTVHVPTADLCWTVSPRFELGYRLTEGAGEFVASYYFLATQGSATVVGFDPFGDAVLTSNLYLHAFDFDYANHEYSLGPLWDMRWRIGARLTNVFFDSQIQGPFVEQRTTNFFLGAGPHAGLDLRRRIAGTGAAMFGRVEGAGSLGRLTQGFEETFAIGGTPVVGGANRVSVIQWVPTVRAQAGMAWSPWCNTPLTISGGYVFEGWWYLGEANGSSATLTLNGIFLRAEWNY